MQEHDLQTPEELEPTTSSLDATPQAPSHGQPRRRFVGLIDWYIIRTFLGTYFFAILLIISVSIVFDINEKIDSFLKPEVTLYEIVFHYYLNFVPYYANMFSPLFVFISVIFFTTRMAENSEIIAILASGMSFKRLLRPYLLSALVISSITFVLNNYIIPPGNKQRFDFENTYIRNKRIEYAESVHVEVERGTFLFIGSYSASNKTGYDIALESFEGRDIRTRLTAERAVYDTLGRWSLYGYRHRQFGDYHEDLQVGESLDTIIPIAPSDFLVTEKDVETLTSPELSRYIDKQSERGVGNAKLFAIELHKRYAAVFSAFILTFIGAVLSAKKVKNGMGLNIAIGLAMSFGYILFTTITSTFAINGSLPPWLSAWLPNFIFVILALSLWRKAPQ